MKKLIKNILAILKKKDFSCETIHFYRESFLFVLDLGDGSWSIDIADGGFDDSILYACLSGKKYQFEIISKHDFENHQKQITGLLEILQINLSYPACCTDFSNNLKYLIQCMRPIRACPWCCEQRAAGKKIETKNRFSSIAEKI